MKKLSAVLLAVGILLCATADNAQAQKGSSGSRSGSSYSSGGGSRSGSSYSSGSSSKPPSSSGNSSNKPATTSGSSYSSSGGRSYSGGSSPPAKSTPAPVSGSGGSSYSGGSSTPNKTPSVAVAPKPVSGSAPGSSYSSGTKTYTPVSSTNTSGSTKPKAGAFDGNAAQAKQREESKAAYIKGAEPKNTYTTPAGKEAKLDTSSKSVTTVRTMSHTTYVTRDTRAYSAFSPYYGRPLVVYNDPYPSFFWYWMLDRSLDERAMWAYHHQHEMDQARYREMVGKDAQLEARIRQLEAQNKGVRDVGYTPKGIDPDLQYSDDFVDAAYNPHVEHDNLPPPGSSSGSSGVGKFFYYVFLTLLVGVGIWFVVWLIFLKNW